jgi:hypothetical protein
VDPAPSSGIAWVKLKYKILGPGTLDYQYSDGLDEVSGGWTSGEGSSWDAYYKGDLTISFSVGYLVSTGGGKLYFRPSLNGPSAMLTVDPFTVEVWSIVRDNAGTESFSLLGTYTLAGSCGE